MGDICSCFWLRALFPNLALFFELLQQGYNVFTFDLDGHGHRSSTYFDVKTFPSCLEDALNHLQVSPNKCHLVGLSLGGALVLHHLSQTQDSVASATIISTPTEIKLGAHWLKELSAIFHPTMKDQLCLYGLKGALPL